MAKPPTQEPFVYIPGIETAKMVETQVWSSGETLTFQIFVDDKQVVLDEDQGLNKMDRSWFGIVIRELDRLNWVQTNTPKKGYTSWIWLPRKKQGD